MEKLLGWLKQNNVNIDNLKIINQQNKERGVVSAKILLKEILFF